MAPRSGWLATSVENCALARSGHVERANYTVRGVDTDLKKSAYREIRCSLQYVCAKWSCKLASPCKVTL